ncbi:hypothetical protein NY98_12390 [Xanthomonas citri pv. fuscans]|uniref:Transposase n=1 Tax=Xanthomonas citri pv. fuscans TaxID=366649 RepID=A0AB34Q674_XANCI|nr:hypothetical protein AC613_10525 [Xanthomonas citri pv. fuscans]AZU21569.1 hypothetical protein AC612_10525 [Xanthomonas citri pv. fuscans]AZU92773.1 hypothetical protein AC614_10530 [Xanthomonas citri pv. fuscans]KGU52529.1 hypothetical protein NY98_12390 [Xanthomonas citri pv. fuscans]
MLLHIHHRGTVMYVVDVHLQAFNVYDLRTAEVAGDKHIPKVGVCSFSSCRDVIPCSHCGWTPLIVKKLKFLPQAIEIFSPALQLCDVTKVLKLLEASLHLRK